MRARHGKAREGGNLVSEISMANCDCGWGEEGRVDGEGRERETWLRGQGRGGEGRRSGEGRGVDSKREGGDMAGRRSKIWRGGDGRRGEGRRGRREERSGEEKGCRIGGEGSLNVARGIQKCEPNREGRLSGEREEFGDGVGVRRMGVGVRDKTSYAGKTSVSTYASQGSLGVGPPVVWQV